ncbi:exosortase family protein XrtF [Flavobacterium adhaerens]|uniref:exosortase family protein XrtF n=1 Tax=Flavobacterium adhaerens TaxID=3149043 RepID=UPI0032B37BC6
MKKYFIYYKPFLFFLASFFGCYILLTFLYQFFLKDYKDVTVDPVTRVVAQNTETLISFFSSNVHTEVVFGEPFVKMYFQDLYMFRIVEGCNAISVVILFISFVVAFSGSLKNTLLFILGGSLVIYILNVIRIALLLFLLYYFPEQNDLWHDIFFPLIIYGLVFILWIIWVNKFSKYAK